MPHTPAKISEMEWLALKDVSRYAAVSERTLRTWIHSPIEPLPAVRVTGKLLVRRTDLDLWLQKHRLQPVAELDVDAIVREALRGSPHGRKG